MLPYVGADAVPYFLLWSKVSFQLVSIQTVICPCLNRYLVWYFFLDTQYFSLLSIPRSVSLTRATSVFCPTGLTVLETSAADDQESVDRMVETAIKVAQNIIHKT